MRAIFVARLNSILIAGCSKECLDKQSIDLKTAELRGWIAAPTDSSSVVSDSTGAQKQTLSVEMFSSYDRPSYEDDCGNEFNSLTKEIRYSLSVTEFNCTAKLQGYQYGIDDDQFTLRFSTNNGQEAVYDFDQPERTKNCTLLDSVVVRDSTFYACLAVSFPPTGNFLAGQKVLFSKGIGIISITNESGVEYAAARE